jgi:hypothetical protein
MKPPTLLNHLLKVELLDLWHAGSGRGQGRALDAVVMVDHDGLPYLPGRQLKGLLREAVHCLQAWGHVPQGTELRLFGGQADANTGDLRLLRSQPGALAVSNAVLDAGEAGWLRSAPGRQALPHLFVEVFSTAIDGEGVAAETSLRGIQMTVPLTLYAPIDLSSSDPAQASADLANLQRAAGLVQQVGAYRSRGAGRARLSLELRP